MENFEQPIIENDDSEKIKRTNQMHKNILSYLHDVIFGLVAVLLVFMLFCRVVIVSGPSMRQTLQNGDGLLLLNNVFYHNPKYGDIIAVLSTGAYNYSMASNYNRLARAATVMIKDGQAPLFIKRESLEDITKNDLL